MYVRFSTVWVRKPFCSRRWRTVRTVDSRSGRSSFARTSSAVQGPCCQTRVITWRSRSPRSGGISGAVALRIVVLQIVAQMAAIIQEKIGKHDASLWMGMCVDLYHLLCAGYGGDSLGSGRLVQHRGSERDCSLVGRHLGNDERADGLDGQL